MGFFLSKMKPKGSFVSIWSIKDGHLVLPLTNDGTYDFIVNWGDGSPVKHIRKYDKANHKYVRNGIYKITIIGTIIGWRTATSKNSIIDIRQWGCLQFDNRGWYFQNSPELNITATDAPNLTNITYLSFMFYNTSLRTCNINHWDVSKVTNMSGMFTCSYINSRLDNWNTSNVTDMSGMFQSAYEFNQDISMWNVSNVKNMSYMFCKAGKFNQPVNNWNISNVTDLRYMFKSAISFNKPLDKWDTSNVRNMTCMFDEARTFNQDISMWTINITQDYLTSFMFIDCPIKKEYRPLNNNNLIKWPNNVYSYTEPCTICYADVPHDEWRATRCKGSTPAHYHAFHEECIESWLESHNTCPYCREGLK